MINRSLVFFGLAGTLGFGVDVALLYLCEPLLGWYGGRAVSFGGAATVTWWFNRRWTFNTATAVMPSPDWAGLWQEYRRYLIAMLYGASLNYLAYTFSLQYLPPNGLRGFFAVAIGSLCGLAVNYALARRILDKSPQDAAP